jgi:hypothetical protein
MGLLTINASLYKLNFFTYPYPSWDGYRMSDAPAGLALHIEDAALAERLSALLANVPGLRLVGASESAAY